MATPSCDECLFWTPKMLTPHHTVPSWCRWHRQAQAGDDPICIDFEDLSDEKEDMTYGR